MTIQELEQIRSKNKKINNIGILITVLSIVITFLGTFILPLVTYLGFILFIVGPIMIIVSYSKFRKIAKMFKHKILKPEIEKRYPEIAYFPDQGLSEEFINSLHLYENPDRFHSEDMLCGKIKDVKFVCSDVHMEERHVQHTKDGTKVYYETIFKGRFYQFEFNKPFKDQLLLVEGFKPLYYSNLEKVELESVDFNKTFKTFCRDKINAFYVLTPKLMLALMELEKENPGRISILIDGNHLNLAIYNNADAFELSFRKQINENFVEDYMHDTTIIEKIIEVLDLDNKIFKEIAEDIKNI